MEDDALRRQLAQLLDGVGAHMTFEEAIADFPGEAMNLRAPNVDYTPWHLVEHLRLTQADILEYVVNEDYVENVGEFAVLRQVMGTWPPGHKLDSMMMYDTYIMKRTQIYLEADQDGRLARRAIGRGTTKSELIREAIEVYLTRPDDTDPLKAFHAALDDIEDAPLKLPDGAAYVEAIRAADITRQNELDEQRG